MNMYTKKNISYCLTALLFAVVFAFIFTALSLTGCSGSGGGGKSLNSATELKEYLDKQPANSPDKPIKVAMKVNEMMIENIREVLLDAGKYVSLNLSGSPLIEIPRGAFENCETLIGITIPNSVTSIGERAFLGTGLTSITIPNSVTSIESGAFAGTALTSITVDSGNPNFTIEGGILYSKTEIFYIPRGISGNVTIPNGITYIYGFEGTNITSITIPNSVTEIGRNAFLRCTSLTSITIPNGVTSIGVAAFMGTGLTSVTIPNSVTSIGSQAFIDCISLTSVTFEGTISSANFGTYYFHPFDNDLRAKYLAGGVGTYTRPNGESRTWTKQ